MDKLTRFHTYHRQLDEIKGIYEQLEILNGKYLEIDSGQCINDTQALHSSFIRLNEEERLFKIKLERISRRGLRRPKKHDVPSMPEHWQGLKARPRLQVRPERFLQNILQQLPQELPQELLREPQDFRQEEPQEPPQKLPKKLPHDFSEELSQQLHVLSELLRDDPLEQSEELPEELLQELLRQLSQEIHLQELPQDILQNLPVFDDIYFSFGFTLSTQRSSPTDFLSVFDTVCRYVKLYKKDKRAIRYSGGSKKGNGVVNTFDNDLLTQKRMECGAEADLLELLEKTKQLLDLLLRRFRRYLQQVLIYALFFYFLFFEFPSGIRPLCTTMPWTIWPALVVLWGVCWMFYPTWEYEDEEFSTLGFDFTLIDCRSVLENTNGPFELPLDGSSLLGQEITNIEPIDPSPMTAVSAEPFMLNALANTTAPLPNLATLPSTFGPDISSESSAVHGTRKSSYTCANCNNTFDRSDALARHRREVHGGARTFECPEVGCNRHTEGHGFKRKYALEQHLAKSCKPRLRTRASSRVEAPSSRPIAVEQEQLPYAAPEGNGHGRMGAITWLKQDCRQREDEVIRLQEDIERQERELEAKKKDAERKRREVAEMKQVIDQLTREEAQGEKNANGI